MSELTKEQRAAAVTALGLTVESVFVPLSQSRNKGEKSPTLNWRVTVKKDGRPILETDYSAGCAHCPSYEQGNYNANRAAAVAWECENGRKVAAINALRHFHGTGKPLEPDAIDVLASLAMDSDVLDAGGFEDWAGDFGYDTDSRKAEAIYRVCLEIALKLRAALGDAGLQSLRNAFEGY